jgi:nitrite reductase/ring-hydroxylating ferredoxin subunit
MNEASDYFELCSVGDVYPDLPFKAQLDGTDLAVFQLAGTYYVTQDTCTHGPGSLCEGYVDGEEIECPFHQGKFSIITGAPTAAPCMEPLKTWEVSVREGKILVPRAPKGQGEA